MQETDAEFPSNSKKTSGIRVATATSLFDYSKLSSNTESACV